MTLAEGLGVVVFEAKDPGKAVDDAIANKTAAPYGAVLWDSAVDVARALRKLDLDGKSVLKSLLALCRQAA